MDLVLEGKTALITGSSRGIGRAIALCLAQEGANVVICSRNRQELNNLETKIIDDYNVVVGSYEVDATKPESVEEMFGLMQRDIAGIDILVNAVGANEKFGKFEDLEREDWKKAYDINFMSAVYFCEKTIPLLKASGNGRIVNIASLVGRRPGLFNPHYAAAKAALINLSKSLSVNLAKNNILVNTICPSSVTGDGFDRNTKQRAENYGISFEQARNEMMIEENKKTPLGRIGNEWDIAYLTAFLASDRASYITGQCIDVEGGVTRSIR